MSTPAPEDRPAPQDRLAPEDRKDTMAESAATPAAATTDAKRGPSIATRERRESSINPSGETPYLVVEDLAVKFPTADGLVSAVNGLSYSVPLGRTLAIVGESGSGKSVSSMAVMGLHDRKRTRITGSIRLGGDELVGLPENDLMKIRGDAMAMVFQDPQSSLHPLYTIGNQIVEAYRVHHKVSKDAAKKRALEMLDLVGIPNPQRRFGQYPHEFSGGMRQRAMIAMSLVNDPKLVIADEPTTALDVTVQAQILDLLNNLQKEFGSAIVMITHDLGVVAEMADDVLVMYAGRCVEYGTAEDVLANPRMPYTWGLLESIPTVSAANERLRPIKGLPPSLLDLPAGCSFRPRCPYVDRVKGELCSIELPELMPVDGAGAHTSRCHLHDKASIYAAEVAPRLG
ncbi:ABC transporter ATP-binding protein [Kribbella kalugense]|uniref:Peptide/nickel transport system ATP-binding protein n=1 Tax=Kribbella kalugense TaxID=2512221 RepID=A0A4R7ZZ92_9ACTN|nr:ABC transporter ATP-binding protein [Kribbella kalugense]TDW23527.1 peptide/nickel transport system ATP-binding protein [Kribbella kalugense]